MRVSVCVKVKRVGCQAKIKPLNVPSPLQFMSTSMPSTCRHAERQQGAVAKERNKRQKVCTAAKLDLRQLIPRIMLPENEQALRNCCAQTLDRICDEYEINPGIRVFQTLRDFCGDPDEAGNSMIALFFLGLDIDIKLKQMMMEAESTTMQRKLTGFFMRLRNELIPAFLCEESIEIEKFVRSCHEAYLVA